MKFALSILVSLILLSCNLNSNHNEAYVFPDFDEGLSQSPINIFTANLAEGHHVIGAQYQKSHELISHEEHTIRVDYDNGSNITFDSLTYSCKQFHFHTPSEHLIDGVRYPMEVHFVHADEPTNSEPQKYFVITILFKMGQENSFLKEFIDNIPEDIGQVVEYNNKFFDISDLVREELKDYYHYTGSLTTPPYTETVHWAISTHILEASPEQIYKLYQMEGNNARHIQAVNGRSVEYVHQY